MRSQYLDTAVSDQPTPTPASKDPALPYLKDWLSVELRKRYTSISEAARQLGLDSKRLHNALHHNSYTEEEISKFTQYIGISNIERNFSYKKALTKSLIEPSLISRRLKAYVFVTAGGVQNLHFFSTFFSQLSERAKSDSAELRNLFVTVPNSVSGQQFSGPELTEMDTEIIKRWKRDGVSGIFFVPTEWFLGAETLNRIILEALKQTGLPIVMLDRDIGPYPNRDPGVSIVQIDHFKGGYLLGNHLALQGFFRPLFVELPHSSTEPVVLRRMGITAALIQHSSESIQGNSIETGTNNPTNPFVFEHQSTASDETEIRSILDSYDSNMCDVIVFHNDDTAKRFISTRVRDPKDLQRVNNLPFAGFDDLDPLAWWTSVKQPMDQLVSAAYEVMETLVARHGSAQLESPIKRIVEPVFGKDQQRVSTFRRDALGDSSSH